MYENQTLVLSQGYEPTDIIHWQDAITMYFTKKCEILEEYDQEIHSAHDTMKVPAVVRLLKHFKRDRKPVRFSRINIYARDNFTCQYCGQHCKMSELTYDHVIPRAQGGKTEWTNIVSACSSCNSWKGGRTPAQAKMKLKKHPIQPRDTPTPIIRLLREKIPKEWELFIYGD